MVACYNGRKDVVQMLLDHSERIDLNARNNYGSAAFMEAHEIVLKDIVQLFLDNSRSDTGRTAFHRAYICSHKDVVQLFLEHSERNNLNARDNYGKTALMLARHFGRTEIVKLLRSRGY